MTGDPRRSRRYAVAFAAGWNITDVEPYQPGRHTPPLYLLGASYAMALRAGEHPPAGYAWRDVGEACGYRIVTGDPA